VRPVTDLLLRIRRALAWIFLAVLLSACSSPTSIRKPADLTPTPDLIGVRLAWSQKIGEVAFPLEMKAAANLLALASSNGTVLILDPRTGQDVWRASLNTSLAAGVGFDGKAAAVVSRNNELIVMAGGREMWRQRLAAQSFTAPLVAGGRVFVLSGDRSVSAYDLESGRRLWLQQRAGEALVLSQGGVLLAVGDTLVVGLSGRLVGMNPLNGSARWEVAIANPRGTNDVERLVDLVSQVSREGDRVCVRAFQSAIGCVNANRGTLLWTRPAFGSVGLHSDGTLLFGVEGDDTLNAWRLSDGERVWSMERLRYRRLGPPLVLGRSVVVGDGNGLLHFLSREDGAALARISTDGSAISVAPVLTGSTLVAVTRNGGVFGFRPE
jgi:outer membrane protein assembly factor BamB